MSVAGFEEEEEEEIYYMRFLDDGRREVVQSKDNLDMHAQN